jgi:hypothetical protein
MFFDDIIEFIKMIATNETQYWLFSTSAQAIATFVAFLLAGYALVYSIMEGLEQRDESLGEIHIDLKKQYYERIRIIAFLTGLSIIMSLTMILLNQYNHFYKYIIVLLVFILNIVLIAMGIAFVISIIDPDKYQKTARKIISEEEPKFPKTGQIVSQKDFVFKFIKLEKQIRDFIEKNNVPLYDLTRKGIPYGFRHMIEALLKNELVDRDEYELLIELSKYRNLYVHGHIDSVDKIMLDKIEEALNLLNTIQSRWDQRK